MWRYWWRRRRVFLRVLKKEQRAEEGLSDVKIQQPQPRVVVPVESLYTCTQVDKDHSHLDSRGGVPELDVLVVQLGRPRDGWPIRESQDQASSPTTISLQIDIYGGVAVSTVKIELNSEKFLRSFSRRQLVEMIHHQEHLMHASLQRMVTAQEACISRAQNVELELDVELELLPFPKAPAIRRS